MVREISVATTHKLLQAEEQIRSAQAPAYRCCKTILAKDTSIMPESPEARQACSNLPIPTALPPTNPSIKLVMMMISGTRVPEVQMEPQVQEVSAYKLSRGMVGNDREMNK